MIHFTEDDQARAAFFARALADAGHGVIWLGSIGVMTSATAAERRRIAEENPGVDELWYKRDHIDVPVDHAKRELWRKDRIPPE